MPSRARTAGNPEAAAAVTRPSPAAAQPAPASAIAGVRTQADSAPHGVCGASFTLLPDLSRLRIGGIGCDWRAVLSSIHFWNAETGKEEAAGNLIVARYEHGALPLRDGRVLVVGGQGVDNKPTGSVEIYDIEARKSRLAGSLVIARCFPSLTELRDGRVLVAGGNGCAPFPWQKILSSIEVYNPKTGKSRIVARFRPAQWGESATLLKDGRVLFTGARDAKKQCLHRNEIYDPATGRITPTGSMKVDRCDESIVMLRDGRILFLGGVMCGPFPEKALTSAEIFDPRTGRFHLTGDMSRTHLWPTTMLLKDGKVLVAGGAVGGMPYVVSEANAEIFDPQSGTFTPTGSLTTPRTGAPAQLLADGRVLIQGGSQQLSPHGMTIGLSSIELYDPVQGRFTLVK